MVKNTGDGLMATFDGPSRGIGCAQALIEALRPHGLEIRGGLHTGEIELETTSGDVASGSGLYTVDDLPVLAIVTTETFDPYHLVLDYWR